MDSFHLSFFLSSAPFRPTLPLRALGSLSLSLSLSLIDDYCCRPNPSSVARLTGRATVLPIFLLLLLLLHLHLPLFLFAVPAPRFVPVRPTREVTRSSGGCRRPHLLGRGGGRDADIRAGGGPHGPPRGPPRPRVE